MPLVPLDDLQVEIQRAGKEAWKTGENKEYIWFFWFSSVELDLCGEIAAPLEGGEWPPAVEDKDAEFEWRRRRLEVGMFHGSKNDQVYRVCIELLH